MKRIPVLLALIAMLPIFSAAYGAEDSPPPASAAPLENAAPLPNTGVDLVKTLEDHRWTLSSATDADNRRIDALFPANGRPFTLTFAAARLSVQGGCNSFAGGYQINAEGLWQAKKMAATMMACEPALMQADTALVALLAQPLHIDISQGLQPVLQLETPAKESLALDGKVTPEAMYGPGTLIFLEVDAQQLKCRNPRNGQTTCLQVREISFDEKGLRNAPPGPWRPFYDTIEGYTHTDGQRNVLRVKRFQRGAVTDKSAPTVYVLDLIVESETVPGGSQ